MLDEFSRGDNAGQNEFLIVTAAIAPSPIYPEAKNAPSSVDATIETASACCGAGASVIRLDDFGSWTLEDWHRVIEELRRRCDAILEVDFSRRSSEEQETLFEMHPDVASVPLGHRSLSFAGTETDGLYSLREIEDSLALCDRFHVKPDLEICHSGSVWRLNDLIARRVLTPPYLLTLYLGWPGGNWSPPSVEELLYRFRLLPADCICNISVAGREQTGLIGLALGLGGHLRVGTRDNPFVNDGVLARDNAQLVQQVAKLGSSSARKPVTPSEARRMIGIPAR